jgi:hypothetical protein
MAEVRHTARPDEWRAGILAAMGIEVYRLRERASAAVSGDVLGTSADTRASANAAPRVLIVCAHGQRGEARLSRLYAQLPRALRVDAAAIRWSEADAQGAIPPPPSVSAYLALGAPMARALGTHLSTAQQQAAVIAVTADAAQLPGDATGKRALWQALKPIARALRDER